MTKEAVATWRSEGFDPRPLYAEGLSPGQADLIVGADTKQVIGRSAALSLFFQESAGKSLFLGITVVAPPEIVWPLTNEQVLQLILAGMEYIRSVAPEPAEVTAVKRRLTIRRCADLSRAALLAEVEGAALTKQQFILIPMAHLYVDPSLVVTGPLGHTSVRLSEDRWVPQIAAWVPTCLKAIRATAGYLVIDVPEFPPGSPEHRQILVDIEDLFPVFATHEGHADPGRLVQESASRWAMLAMTGRIDEALDEIKALDMSDEFKQHIEIQILSRGNDAKRTLEAVRSFESSSKDIPAELAVRFGRIAHQAGDNDLASRLISAGIDETTSQVLLEAALRTSERLNDPQLEARVYRRLTSVFPGSNEIQNYHERLVINLCDTDPVSQERKIGVKPGSLGFENRLVSELLDGDLNGAEVIELADHAESNRERDLVLIGGAIRALRRGESHDAFFLATKISKPSRFDRYACFTLLAVMRRQLLQETGAYDIDTPFGESLAFIRDFIASHPDDAELRGAFASLFSVSLSASVGLPILAAHALNLASRPQEIAHQSEDQPEASIDELSGFLERADAWQQQIPGLEVGFTTIPSEVVGEDPSGILRALIRFIDHVAQGKEPEDLERAERLSFLACLITRQVPDTAIDIDALRMVACRQIQAGRSQRGRDLAEQILQLAGASRRRQRAAWTAYADIYHRTRNPLDALLGLNCAFAIEQHVEAESAWWELYTLLRIARDLGLSPIANRVLESLRAIQALMPESAGYELRLKSLELGLLLLDPRERSISTLEKLVNEADQHCRRSLGNEDDQLPAISLLAQAIGLLELAGGRPTAEARALLQDTLVSLEPAQAEFVRAVASATPTIKDAMTLHGRVEAARYVDDVPGDLIAAEIVARRLLRDEPGIDVPQVASAIELLADHALDPPEARVLDTTWPIASLAELRPADGAILMTALNSDGALVCLTVGSNGTKFETVSTEGGSFRRHLSKWSEEFPFRYGLIEREQGNNIFFQTMEKLPVPVPSEQRVVVIAEPGLQLIPPNLILVDENFAGSSKALAYVPSLTWLDAVREKPRNTSNTRIAWLSEARKEGQSSAIDIVLNVTRETLEKTGFEICTSTSVPSGLGEAQIAIVTAHGSVSRDGRFFHRISDEGELMLSPSALAGAVGGAELVILFVCSAGRTDSHPFLNTAVGLPKLLLAAGTRTVIASPWPLSSQVTGPWLDAFMTAWEAGQMAIDANFRANTAVDCRYGYVPQYSLAMTVYGDPYLYKLSDNDPPVLGRPHY